jgi:hypothetical protein
VNIKFKTMAIHKGTELNNVNETWKQNERNRDNQEPAGNERSGEPATVGNDLEETIKEEAAEYDRADKEERILDGERATVRDGRND